MNIRSTAVLRANAEKLGADRIKKELEEAERDRQYWTWLQPPPVKIYAGTPREEVIA